MTVEDAAVKVGVSKKSLDDYLLQLRKGQKSGFDFEQHKDDNVGVLRQHNKKVKEEKEALEGKKKAGKGK